MGRNARNWGGTAEEFEECEELQGIERRKLYNINNNINKRNWKEYVGRNMLEVDTFEAKV